jgi:twinkle protein
MSEVVERISCPVCLKQGGDFDGDNLVIYSDGHGYCFACNTYFPNPKKGREVKQRKTMSNLIPPESLSIMAIKSRKISKETAEKYRYKVGKINGKRVHVADYYDQQGNLVAQHVRFVDEKKFIWLGTPKKLQLFGQQLWAEKGRKLIITEGELDALSISQIQGNKYPVVSIPSGASHAPTAIKDNIEWIESFDEVIFCFDMDEAGQTAVQKCARLLTPGKAKIMHLPLKDPNEMLMEGRTQELVSAIWQAKVWRPDGIVNGAELWEVIKKPPEKGIELPYPQLQEMTYGLRQGELWLFTAGSGIGKSTLVHELSYHLLMNYKLPIGVLALEENVKKASERYLSIYLNKPIYLNRDNVTEEEIRDAYEKVLMNGNVWFYDHFGSTEIDNLLAKIRYMIVANGVRIVILDHISIVVSGLETSDVGDSERKLIDIFMTKLRSLVQETGVTVLAVVHLKRPSTGISWNEGRQVSLTDLRGSGALEQLSDIVIALERNQQDKEKANVATLRVLKNRPIGICGVADTLVYNPHTGRLLLEKGAEFVNTPLPPVADGFMKEGESDF